MSLLSDLHELRAEFAVSGDEFAAVRLATALAKRKEQPLLTPEEVILELFVLADGQSGQSKRPSRTEILNAIRARDEQVAAARDDHWRQVAEEVIAEIEREAELAHKNAILEKCDGSSRCGLLKGSEIIRRFFAKEKA